MKYVDMDSVHNVLMDPRASNYAKWRKLVDGSVSFRSPDEVKRARNVMQNRLGGFKNPASAGYQMMEYALDFADWFLCKNDGWNFDSPAQEKGKEGEDAV